MITFSIFFSGPQPLLSQVEFECATETNQWSHIVQGGPDNNVRTDDIVATLDTNLWTNCSFCVSMTREPVAADNVHHCLST